MFASKKNIKVIPRDEFNGDDNCKKEISINDDQVPVIEFTQTVWALCLNPDNRPLIYLESDDNTLDIYEYEETNSSFSKSSLDFFVIKQLAEKVPF